MTGPTLAAARYDSGHCTHDKEWDMIKAGDVVWFTSAERFEFCRVRICEGRAADGVLGVSA